VDAPAIIRPVFGVPTEIGISVVDIVGDGDEGVVTGETALIEPELNNEVKRALDCGLVVTCDPRLLHLPEMVVGEVRDSVLRVEVRQDEKRLQHEVDAEPEVLVLVALVQPVHEVRNLLARVKFVGTLGPPGRRHREQNLGFTENRGESLAL